MTDLDTTSPQGTEPTQEEIQYVLQVADVNNDETLSPGELEYALQAWKIYTEKRGTMEEKIKEFDKSGTGGLEKPELKQYLISLNGGQEVTDQEVDWVFEEADIFGDGTIHATELVKATAAWYSNAEQKEASGGCCTVS
eukprot:gnl/TRDRNA2_/TRDRNA2_80541_c1_seq1.p1 gnl/TRDRNA2_/TRDRNA2_80541_c1~~gnl/TRDRNA2_/TRDRNA2_80541_c1_seq1.p1  ORF type:complete len:139 (+),score=26.38 gnl/TRDRNA2_/TRDRNA2_80541_c1_seq1:2-418(+)